jgi:hypothetical protein
LLADFDPRKTEPVPPVVLDDPGVAPALDAMAMGDPRKRTTEPPEHEEQRRKKSRAGTKSSEIAVAVGAGLVLIGIFVSFLGGESGMVSGPILAFAGAGMVALALARRLK